MFVDCHIYPPEQLHEELAGDEVEPVAQAVHYEAYEAPVTELNVLAPQAVWLPLEQ